jgi:hypothetical protein
LPEPQLSPPAAGRIDGDAFADFAVADGHELHVLITDSRGPTSQSWTAPSRSTEALLANLTGDSNLEVVAERVFDSRGRPVLELEQWSPGVVPSALARTDASKSRALLQVERNGEVYELTRYDVELALRAGDRIASRRVLATLHHPPARGGFAVADVTGDGEPDVLLPTEDGLLFIVDGDGKSPALSPLPTLGSVVAAPSVGVREGRLEFAVRTTRGDLVRWLARGFGENISWEGAGHDRGNTRNAETKLPTRRIAGLGVTSPDIAPSGCGCTQFDGVLGLTLVFLFRRRRRTC